MNLANFCRNCLSRWYREEAEKKGVTISDPDARERIYGMPYTEWKEKYQKDFKEKFNDILEFYHQCNSCGIGFTEVYSNNGISYEFHEIQ